MISLAIYKRHSAWGQASAGREMQVPRASHWHFAKCILLNYPYACQVIHVTAGTYKKNREACEPLLFWKRILSLKGHRLQLYMIMVPISSRHMIHLIGCFFLVFTVIDFEFVTRVRLFFEFVPLLDHRNQNLHIVFVVTPP